MAPCLNAGKKAGESREPNDGRRLAARRRAAQAADVAWGARRPASRATRHNLRAMSIGRKKLNDGAASPGRREPALGADARDGAAAALGEGARGAIIGARMQEKVAIPKRHKIKTPPPAPTAMLRRLEEKPFRRLKGGLEGFSFDFSTPAQQLRQEMASTRLPCAPIVFPIRPNEGSIPPRPSEGSARSEHPGWGAPQAQAQPRRASPRRRGKTDWAKRA